MASFSRVYLRGNSPASTCKLALKSCLVCSEAHSQGSSLYVVESHKIRRRCRAVNDVVVIQLRPVQRQKGNAVGAPVSVAQDLQQIQRLIVSLFQILYVSFLSNIILRNFTSSTTGIQQPAKFKSRSGKASTAGKSLYSLFQHLKIVSKN